MVFAAAAITFGSNLRASGHVCQLPLDTSSRDFDANSLVEFSCTGRSVDFQIPQNEFAKPMFLDAFQRRGSLELEFPQDLGIDEVLGCLRLAAGAEKTPFFQAADPVPQLVSISQR